MCEKSIEECFDLALSDLTTELRKKDVKHEEINEILIDILSQNDPGEQFFFRKYLGITNTDGNLMPTANQFLYNVPGEIRFLIRFGKKKQLWIVQTITENNQEYVSRVIQIYEKQNIWVNVTKNYRTFNTTCFSKNIANTHQTYMEKCALFVQTWGADSRYRPDTEATGQMGSLLEQHGFKVVHASRFFLEGENIKNLASLKNHLKWWIEHICDLVIGHKATHICIAIYDNTIPLTIQLMRQLRKKFGNQIKIILGGPGASSFAAAEKRLGFNYGLWGNPGLRWDSQNRPLHDVVINSPSGHSVLLELMKSNCDNDRIPGLERYFNGNIYYSHQTPTPSWESTPTLNVKKMLEHYPDDKKKRSDHSFTVHQECPAFWSDCLGFCGGQRGLHLNIDPTTSIGQANRGVSSSKIAADILALIDDAKTTRLFPSVPDITPFYILNNIHSAITENPRLKQLATNKSFKMGAFVRLSNLLVSPALYIQKFSDINLQQIYVGFENLKFWIKASDRQAVHLEEYLRTAENCFMLLKEAHINVELGTCFGFPEETIEDAMVTVRWINKAVEKGILPRDLAMTSYSDMHNLEIPYSAYTKEYLEQLKDHPEDILYRVGTDFPSHILVEMINQGELDLEKLCKPYSTVERHILPRLSAAIRNKMLSIEKIPDVPYGKSRMSFRQVTELMTRSFET